MIPRNPDDVTADWLSGVLGTEVRTLELNPIGTGQTGATYRLSVGYTDEVGLPASFAIKLPSQDDGVRDRVAIGYRSEHAFYRDVADLVSIPVPHSYYCEIEDDGAEFALLLADMAPAEQGDQIAGCSAGDALLAVRALAGLHAPSWCDPKWTDFPGIAMPRPDEDMAFGMGEVAKMASAITLEKLGARMTAADRDTMEAALSVVTPWLLAEPDRFALLHGDYRLDNMLFDPGHTEITIVDWQTLGSGLPARDLSYFTATSLDPDIRLQAVDPAVDAVVFTVAGSRGTLDDSVQTTAKLTPFDQYPRKGRATGGGRCQRVPKGEDCLALAWAGAAPARAAQKNGSPADLPDIDPRRDGSGVSLAKTVAVVAGPV